MATAEILRSPKHTSADFGVPLEGSALLASPPGTDVRFDAAALAKHSTPPSSPRARSPPAAGCGVLMAAPESAALFAPPASPPSPPVSPSLSTMSAESDDSDASGASLTSLCSSSSGGSSSGRTFAATAADAADPQHRRRLRALFREPEDGPAGVGGASGAGKSIDAHKTHRNHSTRMVVAAAINRTLNTQRRREVAFRAAAV